MATCCGNGWTEGVWLRLTPASDPQVHPTFCTNAVPFCLLQLVRKLLVTVTAAASDPQLAAAARLFAHGVARHLAMLLAAGLTGQSATAARPPSPAGARVGVGVGINGAALSGQFNPLLYLDALMEVRCFRF